MSSALRGTAYMTLANLAFCAMACLVKYLSAMNFYTTTMFRFLVGLGIIGALTMSGRIHLDFVNKPGLFLRGFLGGVSICVAFFSITKLGIAKASIIVNTYTLFAVVFGRVLLGERLSAGKIAAVLGGFCGICLLLSGGRAGIFTGHERVGVYELIGLAGAAVGGFTVVSVKKLQDTDTTVAIFFAQCLVGLWMVLLPAGVGMTAGNGAMNVGTGLMLLGVGVFATVGQLLSTESYRHISVAAASILVLTSPVLTCFAGIALFHERLTTTTLVASVIVLGSGGLALLGKKNEAAESRPIGREKERAPAPPCRTVPFGLDS